MWNGQFCYITLLSSWYTWDQHVWEPLLILALKNYLDIQYCPKALTLVDGPWIRVDMVVTIHNDLLKHGFCKTLHKFFANATLTSCSFFFTHFGVGLLLLCICTHPKVSEKKWATGRKRSMYYNFKKGL